MKKFILPLAMSMFAATAVSAQTPAPAPATPAAPAEKIEVTPPLDTAKPTTGASSSEQGVISLTDEQAKAWVDKPVVSSDEKSLGEVAAVARDSSGNISELHADIGGFLGLGETRVRVMPTDFKMVNEKIVLNLTADQAKTLPRIAK